MCVKAKSVEIAMMILYTNNTMWCPQQMLHLRLHLQLTISEKEKFSLWWRRDPQYYLDVKSFPPYPHHRIHKMGRKKIGHSNKRADLAMSLHSKILPSLYAGRTKTWYNKDKVPLTRKLGSFTVLSKENTIVEFKCNDISKNPKLSTLVIEPNRLSIPLLTSVQRPTFISFLSTYFEWTDLFKSTICPWLSECNKPMCYSTISWILARSKSNLLVCKTCLPERKTEETLFDFQVELRVIFKSGFCDETKT